jgi:hypothetical protein
MRQTSLLLVARGEVPHFCLVRKLHDGSVGADREHRVDVLRRDPRNHAELRVLLLDAASAPNSTPMKSNSSLCLGEESAPFRRNCVTP